MIFWYVVGTSKDDAVVYPCSSKREAIELCDKKSNLFLDWEFAVTKPVYVLQKIKVGEFN